jgi:hypothetical protein
MPTTPDEFSRPYIGSREFPKIFPTRGHCMSLHAVWLACHDPDTMFAILEHISPPSMPKAVSLAIYFAKSVLHIAETKSAVAAILAAESWLSNPSMLTCQKSCDAAIDAFNDGNSLSGTNSTTQTTARTSATFTACFAASTAWACGRGLSNYFHYTASAAHATRWALSGYETRTETDWRICEIIREHIANPFSKPE